VSLNLNPHTTALVLIDLQNGIVGRALAPYEAPLVIKNACALGQQCAAVGAKIVLVNVAFSIEGGDRLKQPIDSPMPVPPGGFPPGFSDFAPEIAALKPDVIVTKRQWGAFYGTELDLQLRRRGIDTIILGGIATNFGVESTARDAWERNYTVIIAEDACTSMSADAHQFAIEKIFPRISRVRKSSEILSELKAV